MKQGAIQVTCPECGVLMKVDPNSGKVLAHGEGAKGPADLGEAVQRRAARDEKVKDSFAAAMEAERNRKKELEDLFRKASDKAKKDDGDAPENPLDDRWR